MIDSASGQVTGGALRRLRRATGPLVGAALLLAAAGCVRSGADAAAHRSPSPSPSAPSPAPMSPPSAATVLAGLAAKARTATYTATYRFRSGGAGHTVRFARNDDGFRLDVTTHGSTATLIRLPRGVFQCTSGDGRPACARVAGPGRAVPRRIDPRLQYVFTEFPGILAGYVNEYAVTRAARPPTARGSCFDVRARPGAAPPRVADGTYCFDGHGVLTGLRYPTGTLIRRSTRPAPKHIRLPAKPKPLPGS